MNTHLLQILNELASSNYDSDELCNAFSCENDCIPADINCSSCPIYGGPTNHIDTCMHILHINKLDYSNEHGTLIHNK